MRRWRRRRGQVVGNSAPIDGAGAASSLHVERIAADWLARRDGDVWTDADAHALEAWLAATTAHRVAFLRLEGAWHESARLQALGAGVRDGSRRTRWPAAAAAAAVVAVALLAGAVPLSLHRTEAIDASSHQTALGAISTVPLADGSLTTLGSDSQIDVRLSPRQREVELRRGEAHFAAARDPRRPFVVQAGARRVVAIGTRFSVRMDGDDLRVVVTEGSVRLESADRPAATVLPAGSVALATASGLLVNAGTVAEAERMVGWLDGVLVFHDTALSDAVAEFNRYSRRRIVVADAAAGALRIGGSFRWSNAEGFVRLLEQGFPVRADYGREEIVLHTR